jgi:hypothetical protein
VCQHEANDAPCNDGLFCNGGDTCGGGTCSVHSGDPCDGPDGDGSCAESCNESADNCTAADPDGSACNDGDFCTVSDECSGGTCTGEPSPDEGCVPTTTTLPDTTTTTVADTTTTTLPATTTTLAGETTTTTVSDGTTTTTVPESMCGDVNRDDKITAGDALMVLRGAVGTTNCPLEICDYNGNGTLTAGDALAVLRVAVGQQVEPNCPQAALLPASTVPSSTTTTL